MVELPGTNAAAVRAVPLLENTVWAGVYALGALILWPLQPFAAIAYLVYALGCMHLLLPRLVCTACACYGGGCHSGQGWIAARLFARRDPAGFRRRFRHMRLAAPVFLAPLLVGIAALPFRFSLRLAGLTVAFGALALGGTRLVTQRLGCPDCAQRHDCPGCAGARARS